MFTFKTFNNIAEDGLAVMASKNINAVSENPDALILRSHKLVAEEFGHNLSAIARAGAGVNNIPVKNATDLGVVVFNTPGANANAVKELVICGMLLSSRGIVDGINFAKNLESSDSDALNKMLEAQKKTFAGNELSGKTIGIVGLGAIGSMLAQASQALGMKLVGYDPHISIDSAWRLPREVEKAETLEDLLKKSDYVSLHVPLVEATKNLINADNLKYFKSGSRLINLSRGGIVNSNDVIQALENGSLSKFVTDFPTPELIARSAENSDVILLPHMGASTKEAEVNCAVMAANQIANFLQRGVIINSINFPNVSLERSTPHRLVIITKNEPGMISKITDSIASLNLNIAEMSNKSRDEIAINLIDLEYEASDELVSQLKSIEHVLKVRSINTAS
ncbi:3-phosphoglycerate dehydrogenase family protein [Gammaproteobacteria bacterium]|jgi:D-3-phosphoglycerate dehydrogenase / 2-oxoglutarate reductase|nr:3-phosphoglycerate dehydrogenase family protein [Gammaproteobacteria bacterium]MDA9269054.1 3-phosphoglycerate dehydrogenase family protein [Gammaproteobacteria bacterium]MDB4000687.1 3-phosphoglycerate dehydrogenase family protein [Gammaproteobacteria bacterium]MDB4120608.1 3-phosphoglycerate dehydrogenase family protein [Gammaproteobacteria bacterium]MDB9860028.1 3-phosphoglycerate dehydrogenase family protein [Gammaproteobacteria bacterium]